MKTKKLLTLILLLLSHHLLSAQGKISGTIRDGETTEAIAFAICILLRPTDSLMIRGTATDLDGHFHIDSVPAGRYILRVSSIGYTTLFSEVTSPQTVTLNLQRSSSTLVEVSISDQRPIYSSDGEKVLYHVGDDPSVQTGSAMEVLQNAPGVEVDAAGNISLKGSKQVAVWINDRPSHLDGDALKQYLKSLPAGNIKRVEVISNPSARYGSDASAIVNIITNQRIVRNELLCLGLHAASNRTVAPWLSYVWANEKLSVNVWVGGDYSDLDVKMESQETMLDSNGSVSADYGYKAHGNQRSIGGYGGLNIDYQIDSVSTLTAWGGFYPGKNTEENHYDVLRTEHIYSRGNYNYTSDIKVPSHYRGGYGGLYFQRQLDTLGQMISISVNSNYDSQNRHSEKNRHYEEQHHLDVLHDISNRTSSWWSGMELNYVKPYSQSGQVELGGSGTLGRNSNTRIWDTLSHSTNLLSRDAERTFSSRTTDNELSFYATLQQSFGKLILKGGARVYRKWKNTVYFDLPQPTDKYNIDKDFWDFIPSLHASYSTESGHNFTLSYTRRFLSPNATYWSTYMEIDEESYTIGNPDLRFSHTHNLEGEWTWYRPWGSLGLSAYINANTDEMQQINDVAYSTYFQHVVDYSQYRNIGSSSVSGVTANLTLRPKPFFNIRLYTNLYDYHYNFEYRPNQWQDTSMLTFSLRLNVWAQLWNKLQVFANANYRSQSLSLMLVNKPDFTVDLGLSSDLFDRRLSLYLKVDDALNTRSYGSSNINPYYTTNYSYTYNSFSVNLGIIWRIGKMELESKAHQGGGTATLN